MTNKTTHSIDLTIPVFLWTGLFVWLALTHDNSLTFWVLAALPWVFMVGFWALTLVIVAVVLGNKYRQGYPITLTTPRKGTRVVRRQVYR